MAFWVWETVEDKAMTGFNTFKRLIAWQKGMDLVQAVYKLSGELPAGERYVLSQQMRRAAISVPCNIAEGFGRCTRADFVRFLDIASGSLNELETQLLVCVRVGHMDEQRIGGTMDLTLEVQRVVKGLIRSLQETSKPNIRA